MLFHWYFSAFCNRVLRLLTCSIKFCSWYVVLTYKTRIKAQIPKKITQSAVLTFRSFDDFGVCFSSLQASVILILEKDLQMAIFSYFSSIFFSVNKFHFSIYVECQYYELIMNSVDVDKYLVYIRRPRDVQIEALARLRRNHGTIARGYEARWENSEAR